MDYKGTPYYYAANLQGDTVAILDGSGNPVVTYTYDAWGKLLSIDGSLKDTLGVLNPLTYRGYVYDTETEFYYLQSRYYNPTASRFLNADAFASTGQGLLGNNMFAYCLNNPIAFVDLFGYHASYCFVHCDSEGGGGYITDQNDPAVAYKRFGLATISHSGCGIIASYNALISMGNRKEFDEVLAYYNSEISNILGYGLTGLLPSDVGSFFNYLGYTTVITMSPTAIKYLSKKADACIMYYMFPRTYSLGALSIDAFGAHFVEYSRLGNQYIARNTGGRNGTSSFSDPFAYGEQGSRYCVVGIFIFK